MVEFDNHRDAALAKKRLVPEGITVAGCRVKVDWARSDLLEGEQSKRVRFFWGWFQYLVKKI